MSHVSALMLYIMRHLLYVLLCQERVSLNKVFYKDDGAMVDHFGDRMVWGFDFYGEATGFNPHCPHSACGRPGTGALSPTGS